MLTIADLIMDLTSRNQQILPVNDGSNMERDIAHVTVIRPGMYMLFTSN